jgi:hypothetical protein
MIPPKGFTGGYRYTVRLEFCGHPEPYYVARFCGEWIDKRSTESLAWRLAQEHYNTKINPDGE